MDARLEDDVHAPGDATPEDPRDSSWRYDRGGKAAQYRERSSARREREARLMESILEGRDLGDVLDVPCGAGRLRELVLSLDGNWFGADLSTAMLKEAKLAGANRILRARAERLPFVDQSFDTVVCFRFLHHLTADLQTALLDEIARVSSRQIVISGFSRWSFHELKRRFRIVVFGKRRARFTTRPTDVDAVLARHGFRIAALHREGFGRDLWLGRWERT